LISVSSAFRPVFATGWASETTDALINLIGRDKLTTVENAIKILL